MYKKNAIQIVSAEEWQYGPRKKTNGLVEWNVTHIDMYIVFCIQSRCSPLAWFNIHTTMVSSQWNG